MMPAVDCRLLWSWLMADDSLEDSQIREALTGAMSQIRVPSPDESFWRRLRRQRLRRRAGRVATGCAILALAVVGIDATIDREPQVLSTADTTNGPTSSQPDWWTGRSYVTVRDQVARQNPGRRTLMNLEVDSAHEPGSVSNVSISQDFALVTVAAGALAANELAVSGPDSPPAGVVAGRIDQKPSESQCPPRGRFREAGRPVRFLHDEFVGCQFSSFVWSDQLGTPGT